MARIGGKDTKPELLVRRALWGAGLRYRKHRRDLPGRPDIVFSTRRIAIFVHGCFWHAHEGCDRFRVPKTRSEWWIAKLQANRARDAVAVGDLERDGWRVIVIWECEIGPSQLERLCNDVCSRRDLPQRSRK